MRKKIFAWLFVFLSVAKYNASANNDSLQGKFVLAGLGNYEYVYGGLNLSFKNKIYLEAASGIKPWNFSNEKYFMGYFTLGKYIVSKKNTSKILPTLHLKLIGWNFENVYNKFVMLGINPEIRLGYKLNSFFNLNLTGGVIYNTLLYYKRKTYLEVGWPVGWAPSFSVQLLYRI